MKHLPNYQKILIVATHCIGDSLLITPFAKSLRRAFPQAQIDVLVNERGGMVFENNKDINGLVAIPAKPKPADYLRLVRLHGRYDLVVNEMLNDRTAIYSLVFGKDRIGAVDARLKGAWFKKWVFKKHIVERDNFEHKISRCARILDLIDVELIPKIESPQAALPAEIAAQLPEHYVVVHAPSSNEIKQWPVDNWLKLITQMLDLGYRIVLSGAPIDRDKMIVEQLLSALPSSENLVSVLGQLSLAQTSTLLKQSRGFVGPDCGPGHMASGFPVPLVILISVAPASKWAPWPYEMPVDRQHNLYQNRTPSLQIHHNVAVLQSERACVPCYKNKCRISDDLYSPCLADISPERVIDAVQRMIPLP